VSNGSPNVDCPMVRCADVQIGPLDNPHSGNHSRLEVRNRTATLRSWLLRKVRASTTGYERALLIVEVRFGRRILPAHAHDARLSRKIPGGGGFMIVHTQINCGNRPSEYGGNGIVGGNIHNGRQNSAVRVAALRVDHPLFAPGRLDFHSILTGLLYD